MPIQFRSRIVNQQLTPTIIGANTTGWCCKTGLSNQTKAQCPGGVFIPNAVDANQCPKWGACSSSLIGDIGGACCHWKKNDGTYIQVCKQCTSREECLAAHEGYDEGLSFTYYNGRFCTSEDGDIVCNGVKVLSEDFTNCIPDDYSNCFNTENILGNCCTEIKNDCDITTKKDCTGVWSPAKNATLLSCTDNSVCNGVYFPSNNTPPRTTITTVSNSTNFLEILPEVGSYYQGGIYVGIFYPGSSTVYGNIKSGIASNYYSRNDIGYGESGWILIADIVDFKDVSYNNSEETQNNILSSTSDGLYNTFTNTETQLYKAIKNYKSNGLTDWYLPSQDELALYFKNIKTNTVIYNNAGLSIGSYLTSTAFSIGNTQNFNNYYYIYSQQNNTVNYGFVSLHNRKTQGKIRLFRRIYLD